MNSFVDERPRNVLIGRPCVCTCTAHIAIIQRWLKIREVSLEWGFCESVTLLRCRDLEDQHKRPTLFQMNMTLQKLTPSLCLHRNTEPLQRFLSLHKQCNDGLTHSPPYQNLIFNLELIIYLPSWMISILMGGSALYQALACF